ncbi:tyrosine protein phosphatase [Filobacillus milosensis]|uniref:Tyrosine-protein phosphatase n=1 Tax=Filobacillus milosensis TaxID=94137 RepID=A0A4Y8IGU8_9BACI|nr:CpsB/CapC family capsule biosynthesis tyrosine phosphatase [Filobacillus milosensis]TFB14165.1 tyrosine protein phosphatase [Filobacillus milosensis]
MIDIHSHILAGIDDGAAHLSESIDMAKQAHKEGIRLIYATPHYLDRRFNYDLDTLQLKLKELNHHLQEEGIDLIVRSGQEIRASGDLKELLESNQVLSLGEKGKFILIEFPSNHIPEYAKRLLFDLQLSGYQPIIAHPERNKEFIEHPDLLYKLVKNGILTQVTTASIAGKFGKKIKKFSLDLIEANLVHFIASDAHNTNNRNFFWKEAWKEISNQFGQDTVYYLKENAEILAENGHIVVEQPMRVKKKKILGLL